MIGKSVCRFHGGTAGAPSGTRNGRYSTGLRTKKAQLARSQIRTMIALAKAGVLEVQKHCN